MQRCCQQFGERYGLIAGVGQGEIRRFGAYRRRSNGGGHLAPGNKDGKRKEPKDENTEYCQDGTKDFSAVQRRVAEGAADANPKQTRGNGEEKQVHPGEVARQHKLHKEEKIAQEGQHGEQKSHPQRPVPAALGGSVHYRKYINSDSINRTGIRKAISSLRFQVSRKIPART